MGTSLTKIRHFAAQCYVILVWNANVNGKEDV